MPESSENLTECVREDSRSSHASESEDSSSRPSAVPGKDFKSKEIRKQNEIDQYKK